MSSIPQFPNSGSEPNYEPDKMTGAQVFVGDTRIPIINDGVELHARKGGVMDINRVADVYFPREAYGINWMDVIGADNTGQQMVAKPVEIYLRDPLDDALVLAHRGYLQSIGAGTETSNEMRMRVGSVTDFLSHIPASNTFSITRVTDVLGYVASTLEDSQPVFDNITVEAPSTEFTAADSTGSVEGGHSIEKRGMDSRRDMKTKRFKSNRDVLADVVRWLMQKLGIYVWFEPKYEGGIALVASQEPPSGYYQQRVDGGGLTLLENNALYEIRPVNRLQLRGSVGTNINIAGRTINVPGDKYPYVTVEHTPMVERAGGSIMAKDGVNTTGKANLSRQAKRQLKSMLDKAGGGSMQAALKPQIRPYTKISARPTMSANPDTDVQPLDYEVEKLVHKVSADASVPKTEMMVSMWVDPDDINVVDELTGTAKA